MAILRLAIRNLQRNRRRTLITLTALVVGLMAMVALRGFINGQRSMIFDNQMQGALGALQVHRTGYVKNVLGAPLTLDFEDTPELRAKVAAVPGVVAVSPRIEFGAQVSTPDLVPPPDDGSDIPDDKKGKTSFFIATAFDPTLEQKVTPKRWEWVAAAQGQMPTRADDTQLVLNDDFAKGMGLAAFPAGKPLPPIEQQLALLAPDRDGSLNGENVILGGTVGSATPNDRRYGYVPLTVAQRLLRMEGRVTEYGIAVAPGADLVELKEKLQRELGPTYEVHTWEDRMPFVKDLVGTQDFVFGIVSTIFLLVVLLGIVNATLMSVLERIREIGTMLAVGMRRKQIVQLFVLEGAVLGIVGSVVGVAIGYAWVVWADRVGIPLPAPGAKVPSLIHPSVTPLFLMRALLQGTLGAALASLWPAMRASNLKPVEALSHT